MRLARRVLVHGDDVRHARTLGVDAPHHVARALRGDHDDVDVGRRDDGIEADVEAVGEGQSLAGASSTRGSRCSRCATAARREPGS